jgi:hypothetical protein
MRSSRRRPKPRCTHKCISTSCPHVSQLCSNANYAHLPTPCSWGGLRFSSSGSRPHAKGTACVQAWIEGGTFLQIVTAATLGTVTADAPKRPAMVAMYRRFMSPDLAGAMVDVVDCLLWQHTTSSAKHALSSPPLLVSPVCRSNRPDLPYPCTGFPSWTGQQHCTVCRADCESERPRSDKTSLQPTSSPYRMMLHVSCKQYSRM